MSGRLPDGWGESDEEIDQLDEDTMRAVEERRLAMIHCLPHPPSKASERNGRDSDMEVDRQMAATVLTGFASSVRARQSTAGDDQDDRMQE
jgi:hypothetical protein